MFKKAERKKSKLRLGISGPSGSGKTWSSLEIATGIGGKIAVIDTESGRAELYAEDFDFDCHQLTSPYTPEKYIQAIKEAEKLGYTTIIIDSLSHAWFAEGGILSIAERGGGSFQNGWKAASPKHNLIVEAIISSGCHVICTMRSKTEYVVEMNEKGKQAPRKVGLAPVQRDNLEYEFTVYMEMSHDNVAHISKDNTRVLGQTYIKPDKEMGMKLVEWLNSGKEYSNERLDKALDAISKSESQEGLKEIFTYYYKELKNDKQSLSTLTYAKDLRKSELENGGDNYV